MATINIANLTFSHKGNYDGSTAYVKNDVVYYATNGNAYIAKQGTIGNVPTNGTYWSQFAAGSGGIWNAGLSLGSAGQAVKVNAAGNALEFGTISSDFVKISSGTLGSGTANWSIDGHFSSTYKDYKIFIRELCTANNGATMYARMNTGGTAYTSSNYAYSQNTHYSNTHSHVGSNAADSFRLHQNSNNLDYPAVEEFTIFDPLNTTKRTLMLHHGHGSDGYGGATNGSIGGVSLRVDTAVTGITIISDGGGNILAGAEYLVYGLKG